MKLRYVDTDEPGISRRRCGRGFVYVRPNGALVKDARDKRRIEKLAVPPAWVDQLAELGAARPNVPLAVVRRAS